MDALAVEAIAGLTSAVTSLLPAPPAPGLQPSVLVTPLKIQPTGLGGFVGVNSDPVGDVRGRRLDAQVHIVVPAADAGAALNSAVAEVTQALLAANRADLASLGILRVSLDELGPRPVRVGPGPTPAAEQEVSFAVLYEFLKLPEAGEGVIEEIPVDTELSITGDVRTLRSGPFTASSLPDFEVVDDPAATQGGPSDWVFDAGEGAIVQRSSIRGGPNTATARKPGTYLVLRETPTRPAVADVTLAADVASTAAGGLGFVFRYQGPDGFYFVLLDSRAGFRLMGRKDGTAFRSLDAGGLDATQGYDVGRALRLRLTAVGGAFQLYIDGVLVLEGEDANLAEPGRVGLMVRANSGAGFYDLMVRQL